MGTTHTKGVLEAVQTGIFRLNKRIGTLHFNTGNYMEAVHNAKRLTDCYNACTGISDPSKAIAEAKEVIKEYMEIHIRERNRYQTTMHGWHTHQTAVLKIKQVLASLGEEVE